MPIAIVTGGNSGIGRATCVLLAERGFDVGLTFHGDEGQAHDAAAECAAHGARTALRQMDLEADEQRDPAVSRPGHAREIAGMIAFLASPEGAYTTGQPLIVDGDMFLMGPIANRG